MRDDVISFMRRHGDVALASVLTALVLAEVASRDGPVGGKVAEAAFAVALGVAAAWRARAPLLLLGLMLVLSVATVVIALTPQNGTVSSAVLFAFLLLAVYSAAAYTSGRSTLLAGAMTVGIYVTTSLSAPPINPDSVVFSRC